MDFENLAFCVPFIFLGFLFVSNFFLRNYSLFRNFREFLEFFLLSQRFGSIRLGLQRSLLSLPHRSSFDRFS